MFPTLETFLYVFTLHEGCIFIIFYTVLRSCAFVFIIVAAMLEILVHQSSVIGSIIVQTASPKLDSAVTYLLYFCYQVLLTAELFQIVFCAHLHAALVYHVKHHFEYFLYCRVITWFVEVTCLLLLTLGHSQLRSWYMFMMIFVVLELYFFVVVYSHYTEVLLDEEKLKRECRSRVQCSA